MLALSAQGAAQDVTPLALDYRYGWDERCPDADQFVALLNKRVPTSSAEVGVQAHSLRLALQARRGGGYEALLSLSDPSGVTSERTVSAQSCADAAEAAALVTAVFISTTRNSTSESPSEAPPRVESPVGVTPPESRAHVSLAPAVRASARTALARKVALALSAGLLITRERRSMFAPGLRLLGTYAQSVNSGGQLRLISALTELDVWPAHFALGNRLDVVPYLHAEAGKQWARWREGPSGAGAAPWFAIGAGSRIVARIAGCFSAELDLSAAFVATRNRFLEGKKLVFAVPGRSVAGGIAVKCVVF
jgi:hypothetical protein